MRIKISHLNYGQTLKIFHHIRGSSLFGPSHLKFGTYQNVKKLWMLYSLKSREQSISYLYYHSAIILQVIELLVYSSTRQYAIKLIIILFSASRERRSHHACFFIESHKQISTLMKYSLLVVPNIFFVESTIHFLRSSMHLKVGCVKIDIL